MSKKIVIGSLVAATMTASAYAADLPMRAPPPPPPPVFSWTGAYVGVNAGGIFNWNNNNNLDGVFAVPGGCTVSAACFGTAVIPPGVASGLIASAINTAGVGFNNNGNRAGFLGGGQIGINYQFTPMFLVGAELDGQGVWTDRNNNGNNFGNNGNFGIGTAVSPFFPGSPVTATVGWTHRLDYLVTARGRAGILPLPNLLLYVTGGAAFGGVHTTAFANVTTPDVTVTAGGGSEWMFLPNWSVKAEALYYDLGRFRTPLPPVTLIGAPGFPAGLVGSAIPVVSFRERGVIARAGINYHFFSAPAAPVVARY